MRKLVIMLTTALFAICAAGALAACGSDSKSPQEAAREAIGDADIDFDDDGVTVRGDDGDSATFGACSDLPEGFPTDDVPLPDEEPSNCSRTTTDGETYYSITWDSDVFDDIKSALVGAGFSVDSEGESESGTSLNKYAWLESDDWDVSLNLNVYDDDDFGGTTTSISVSPAMEF